MIRFIRMPFPYLVGWIFLMAATEFSKMSLVNGIGQMLLFAFVVCLPLLFTKRMAYVDIGWPWGLVLIGVVTFIMGTGNPIRVVVISVIYFIIGGRMGMGALVFLAKGFLSEELPRYNYQRIRWERAGINLKMLMAQIEVLSQGLANASFLALPAFVIAANSTEAISIIEIVGIVVWLTGYVIESVADSQKMMFIHKLQLAGKKNEVCNVGLWKYSRHPNYFGEWVVWNGLIIASIPSWIHLYQAEPLPVWILIGLGLLYISRIMYWVLNTYSGAEPAEYYSLKKRPGYAQYQKTTNMFFPGPQKLSDG